MIQGKMFTLMPQETRFISLLVLELFLIELLIPKNILEAAKLKTAPKMLLKMSMATAMM